MASAKLKQVSPAPTIGALIDKMKAVAIERSALSAKDKALSEEQKSLEAQIIELMDAQETRVGEGKIAITRKLVKAAKARELRGQG